MLPAFRLRITTARAKFSSIFSVNHSINSISSLFFIYMIGWGIVDPLIPIYVSRMFGSYSSAGLVLSVLQFFSLFWALLLGPILDRVQKKNIMLAMFFLYLPISPILLSLQTLAHFIYFRFYHSFISTTLWTTSEAYVREHSPRQKEAQSMGLFDFSVGAGQVVGGLLTVLFVSYLGFNIMYAVTLFSFLALLISMRVPDGFQGKSLSGIKRNLDYAHVRKELADGFSNKRFRSLLTYAFPYFLTISLLPMTLPLFAQKMGNSLAAVGAVAALFYLPTMFESYFSQINDRRFMVTIGLSSGAAIFLALFFVQNVALVFILVLLLGVSLATITPNLAGQFTRCMPKNEMGELSAVTYSMKSLAAAIGPLTAGIIADYLGLNYVFLLGGIIFCMLFTFRQKIWACA